MPFHHPVSTALHFHPISCSSTTCMTNGMVSAHKLSHVVQSKQNAIPITPSAPITIHHQPTQRSRELDTLSEIQKIAREEILSQVTPFIQSVTEMVNSLRLDNETLKNMIRSQNERAKEDRTEAMLNMAHPFHAKPR